MKIVALETVLSTDFPNLLWVQLHTDSGLTGIGETFYWPQAVAAYLHSKEIDPLRVLHESAAIREELDLLDGDEAGSGQVIDVLAFTRRQKLNPVAAGAAIQRVIAEAARNRVATRTTCDAIETIAPAETIIARPTNECVASQSARQCDRPIE